MKIFSISFSVSRLYSIDGSIKWQRLHDMQQSKKGYRFFANTAKISVHPKDMHPNVPLLCTLVSSTAFTLQDAI